MVMMGGDVPTAWKHFAVADTHVHAAICTCVIVTLG